MFAKAVFRVVDVALAIHACCKLQMDMAISRTFSRSIGRSAEVMARQAIGDEPGVSPRLLVVFDWLPCISGGHQCFVARALLSMTWTLQEREPDATTISQSNFD
jgi:hypothetical protein